MPHTRDYFKKGTWNGICQDCRKKTKADKLRKRWDGLWVCEEDWEPRHPSDMIRLRSDDPSVPWTSPDTVDDTIVTTQAFNTGESFSDNTPEAYAYMGYDVAIDTDGDTAVASLHRKDGGVADEGGAKVFTRSGVVWSIDTELTDYSGDSSFTGNSVAISADGNTIALGSPYDDTVASNQGSILIFVRSSGTWSLQARIPHPTPATTSCYLGFWIDLSDDGNTLLAGAYNENSSAGTAYVFTRTSGTWSSGTELAYSSVAASDKYGIRVKLSGDGNYALIGTWGDASTNGYMIEWSYSSSTGLWTEGNKIQSPNIAANDYFGWSLHLSYDGTYGFIGEVKYTDAETAEGAMYVYKRASGALALLTTLTSPNPTNIGWFGSHVTSDKYATVVCIGEEGYYGDADNEGCVHEYTFASDVFTYKKLLQRTNPQPTEYGSRCAMSDDGLHMIVGSSDADGTYTDEGLVTFYSK